MQLNGLILLNRVKTGIPGLDDLIEGGFPESSSILLTGASGTGKTIFCLEYLYKGATLYGEPGMYATLEEGPHNLWWNMQRFRWNFLPLQKDNKIQILKFDPRPDDADLDAQLTKIVDKAREMGAKRLVIDSITALMFWTDKPEKVRYSIYNLIDQLRSINCTTILTCETKGGKSEISRFGVEEFLTDGVVQLFFTPPNRSAFVRKMRGTNHSKGIHPIVINEEGISINAKEEMVWESIKD
ncbi:MAG: ATPase domain-containing protein [Candidatus Micrarchaeia archaeon]|jgi:KaiC/GvpD/RAD55 family RecA-like ATPase